MSKPEANIREVELENKISEMIDSYGNRSENIPNAYTNRNGSGNYGLFQLNPLRGRNSQAIFGLVVNNDSNTVGY